MSPGLTQPVKQCRLPVAVLGEKPEAAAAPVDTMHVAASQGSGALAFGVDDFAAAEPHLRKWIRESAAARARVDAFFRENPGYAPQPAK